MKVVVTVCNIDLIYQEMRVQSDISAVIYLGFKITLFSINTFT